MKLSAVIVVAILFFSCLTTKTTGNEYHIDAVQDDFLEKEMYTQVNMWAYKGVIKAINYSVEIKIPVNTKVKITGMSYETIDFYFVDSPEVKMRILNEAKYTELNIEDLAKRYFGPKPFDLSVFSEKEQSFIKHFEGFYEAGISKKAFIVGRGYPPRHRTPSTDLDTWVYWRNRWKNRGLTFSDGKTYSINGIPLKENLDE